jgi:outer membrane protein assembly factor BamE
MQKRLLPHSLRPATLCLGLGMALGMGLSLAGCSSFLHVYTIDINQGNELTQEMVAKLKPGMNPAQVRYVLGTPLVTDTLQPNRWDYVYNYRPGTYAKKAKLEPVSTRRLTVWFENGVLARWDGADQIPASIPSLPVSKDNAVAGDPL